MTAKETIRAKLFKLRLRARQTGQVRLPRLCRGPVDPGGHPFSACRRFVRGGAAGGLRPLRSGFCGGGRLRIVGDGRPGGDLSGSVCLLELTQGLRCASAATLTFAVAFAFYDWKPLRRPWAMPLVAGTINAATGLIVRSQSAGLPRGWIAFALETALTVGACRCYALALAPLRPGGRTGCPPPPDGRGCWCLRPRCCWPWPLCI